MPFFFNPFTSSLDYFQSASNISLTSAHILVGNASNIATDVAMTGDVSIDNTGATTVNTVGSSSASNIHSAELAANAATSSNTNSTIVKRDGSGNFSAGTITAALSGNATTSTTFTGNLTGDVTSTGMSTTVASVGGSSASNVHSAELLANAATDSNTSSAIVKRDSSGNFSAGTITASLTGTASDNTTYTPNNHGVVVSSSTNAMSVVAPDSSTTKVLKSGGSTADPSWLAYDNANTSSTLVFRDSSGNFSAGTITAALTGVASGNLLKSTGDIDQTSFSASNNQSSAANVTGLAFANGSVRAANILLSVYVDATTPLYEFFTLNVIQKASSWELTATSTGDASGFTFTITNAGQIQYTNSNYAGFNAATVKFRALTLAV